MGTSPTSGLICPTPTAWASSNNYLAVPYGRLFHIYNLSGDRPLRSATSNAHHAPITSVLSTPGMQFVSSSSDATVRFWDVLDGECLRTVDLAHPVRAMCHASDDALLCLTSSELIYLSLDTSLQRTILLKLKASFSARIAASESANVVAFINYKSLHITSLTTALTPHTIIAFPAQLTALAISSNGCTLAVADLNGKIFIIRDPSSCLGSSSAVITSKFTSVKPTILHWHASAVMSLKFVHEDSMLLSGGNEAVLVNWSITSNNFGEKTFLPRWRAPIMALSVSPDEAFYAISHFNNSVSVISQASNTLRFEIRSITADVRIDEHHVYVDHSNERKMSVCDGGGGGTILIAKDSPRVQVFDPIRGQHIRDIDVIPTNEISKPVRNGLQSKSSANVMLVALHPLGDTLATVDIMRRKAVIGKNSEPRSETVSTLRIWERGQEENEWNLSAIVVNPHGDEESILSATFHPTARILVTTGTDRSFRFWRAAVPQKQRSGGRNVFIWRCELSRQYRELMGKCSSFSTDGSLLAIGCGSMVSLWQVEDVAEGDDGESVDAVDFQSGCSVSVEFLQSLVHAPIHDDVESVKYVMSGVALFVAVTANGVYAWNAVTQGIWWSFAVGCDPRTLTVDLDSGRFAIAVKVGALVSTGDESGKMEKFTENAMEDLKQGIAEEKVKGRVRSGAVVSSGNLSKSDTLGDSDCSSEDEDGNSKESKRQIGKNKELQNRGQEVSTEIERKGGAKRKGAMKRQRTSGKSNERDYAIAVFDANSLVPLRVNRLGPNVCVSALSFVNTDGVGSKSGNERSALVCIDGSLEVSVMKSDGDMDQLSLVSDEALGSGRGMEDGTSGPGKLDLLLGEGWQGDAGTGDALEGSEEKVDVKIGSGKLLQVFDDHFAGPIHAQAPVSIHAAGFLNNILGIQNEYRIDTNQKSPGPVAGLEKDQPEQHVDEEVVKKVASVVVPRGDRLSVKDMDEFCSKLVSKNSRSKGKKKV